MFGARYMRMTHIDVHSAVRVALTARPDAAAWFSAVLTTHVVQADVGEALRCVATRRRQELEAVPMDAASVESNNSGNSGHAPSGSSSDAAEAGVRHLLTFVDAETLYRAALGVYELEVAYLVVACSNKDPAESLQQLQVLVLSAAV